MSGPNANFAFVPWLRRGISAAAGALTVDRRLEATVGVSFGAGRSATVVLEIVGPGEVIGLDHRVESRGPASERVTSPIEPAPSPEADNGDVPLRYQVQTTVPEHWIPFLPVAIDVTRRDVMLERGVLFRSAGEPIVEPTGRILRPTRLAGEAYRLEEEELPRMGLRVLRALHRSRWIDGSTHVWCARRTMPGAGEERSGLRFDVAVEPS
jgi:hypothetical protein